MLRGVYPEPIRFALSKITHWESFPRKRESSPFGTDLDPRLRGGDNNRDFHLLGWTVGPWALRVNCASGLSMTDPKVVLEPGSLSLGCDFSTASK